MSHPVQFVEYRCGHCAPVAGAGGTTNRLCPGCDRGGLTPRPGMTAWQFLAMHFPGLKESAPGVVAALESAPGPVISESAAHNVVRTYIERGESQ